MGYLYNYSYSARKPTASNSKIGGVGPRKLSKYVFGNQLPYFNNARVINTLTNTRVLQPIATLDAKTQQSPSHQVTKSPSHQVTTIVSLIIFLNDCIKYLPDILKIVNVML